MSIIIIRCHFLCFYTINSNFVIGKYCNIIFIVFIAIIPIDSKHPKHCNKFGDSCKIYIYFIWLLYNIESDINQFTYLYVYIFYMNKLYRSGKKL